MPPRQLNLSIIKVFIPLRAAEIVAAQLTGPAPTTIKSYSPYTFAPRFSLINIKKLPYLIVSPTLDNYNAGYYNEYGQNKTALTESFGNKKRVYIQQ